MKNPFRLWNSYKQSRPTYLKVLLEVLEMMLLLIVVSIIVRQGIFQRRYIPSKSMLPYLQTQDQLIVERITLNLSKLGIGREIQRGDVIVFYPPTKKLNPKPLHKLARLTGFSSDAEIFGVHPFFFMPREEDAYIKRVIALPGETIEVKADDGVYINGERLLEMYPPSQLGDIEMHEYVMSPPRYSLVKMSDIVNLQNFPKSDKPIVVPEGHYFCMGDNRNNSQDSHVWGFVAKERVIGRAYLMWRNLNRFQPQTISKDKLRSYQEIKQLQEELSL